MRRDDELRLDSTLTFEIREMLRLSTACLCASYEGTRAAGDWDLHLGVAN